MERPYSDPPGPGRSARLCAAARRYTYTGIRVHRQDGEDGRGRARRGEGGGPQRGVITDDCPLLRHGQSTARNPVHSAGSQGTMIRRRSAMSWTARPRREPCVRPRGRERERGARSESESERTPRRNRPGTREPLVQPAITRSIASRKRAFLEARGKRLPRYAAGNGG